MECKVSIKHVNALKSCRAKISDTGDLIHELTFDVVLAPGDLERLLLIFKQQLPVTIEIACMQSRMDLKFELVEDTAPAPGPVDPTTMAELKAGQVNGNGDEAAMEEIDFHYPPEEAVSIGQKRGRKKAS